MSNIVKTPTIFLSRADEELIAQHFEIDSAYVQLAEHLGFQTVEIQWLKSRQHERGSCTLGLLEDIRRKGICLERLMDAVGKCGVVPVLDYLNKRYPEIRNSYLKSLAA
ncbi:hypothetical protein HELRODRAFT_178639 [Helobdella robusta]|uniref:Death domain-containing protein n=1 Tax=Helobdella robusta TaxID=6412 RepID=T1FDH5_HELRO|nr:hypothetical protein HELRODRAFT_178639 [Helobdella robusta]ESN96839.1 hypothetical protein HELRODRAFT_178639 [Helobdella robusta]